MARLDPANATSQAIALATGINDQNLDAYGPYVQAGYDALGRAEDPGTWGVAMDYLNTAGSRNPNIATNFDRGQLDTTIDPSRYSFGGLDGQGGGINISSVGGGGVNYQDAGGVDAVNQDYTLGQVGLPSEVNYQSILNDPMYEFARRQAEEMANRNLSRQGMRDSRHGANTMADTGMRTALEARDRLYQQGLDRYNMGAGNAGRMLQGQTASGQTALENARNALEAKLADARNRLSAGQTNAQTALQASIANQQAQQWGYGQQLAADQGIYDQEAGNWNRGFAADQSTYAANADNFARQQGMDQYQLNSYLDGLQMYNNNNLAVAGLGENALSNATRLNQGYGQDVGTYLTGLSNMNEADKAAKDVRDSNMITSAVNSVGNVASAYFGS